MKNSSIAKNVYPTNIKRQELGEIVPLSTPFVIYFEPTRFCNLKCTFCSNPQIPLEKRMNFDNNLFQKMLKDLDDFPERVKIFSINGVGEPLCHKDICTFIREAKDSGKIEKVRLITNGVLLSPELNYELVDAGLDMLWVSIEAMSSEGYSEIAGKVDFGKLVDNIKDFFMKRGKCQLYVKIVDAGLKDKEDERLFFDTFEAYCDYIMIEYVSNIYSDVQSTENRINRFTGKQLKYYDICDYMFKGLSINADGTCSPCPVDWKEDLKIGDLRQNSLYDIWNGLPYKNLRKCILNGNIKKINTCKECCLYLNAESSIRDIQSLLKHREKIIERL